MNPTTNTQWDVWVKDLNGCTFKVDVTISTDNTPSVTAVIDNQCTGSGSGFTITATGTSGTGTLTYGIGGVTGAFQASPTFTVFPGTYTVWVKDANGCTASAAPLTVYPQLTASAAVTRELSCSPTVPQAQITVTASGGRTSYTYEVSTNGGASYTAMATNVYNTAATAGTYTFRITDSNTPGCTVVTSAIVNAISNPTVTATQVNVSCNGGTPNGSVTLTGAGGSGGYTYSDNATTGFSTTATFTGLAAGSYTFYVRDSKGCPGSVDVTITEPTVLTATASATTFSCNATNVKQSAVVTIDVPTTGTAPYTYSFNGGAFTGTRTLTVSDNGTDQTINYIVRDNNGCTDSGSVVINRLNAPVISGITHTPIYCAPASSTTSTVTVGMTAGTGSGTLTYEITSPAASATSNTTGIFAGLAGGVTYSFKVTDASGCFATGSHTVPLVSPIAAIATKLNDVYCNGGATGSIRYNVSQFVSTYSYSVNGAAAVTAQSAAVFTLPNLSEGIYNVVFTDETTGCTASTSINISEPALPLSAAVAQVNANCNVATSKVTVTASGGTPGYTYAYKQDGVAPSAADYVASNTADLNPTTNTQWDVWVKDLNGCTFKVDVTLITDSAPATVTATGSGCLGTAAGYIITATVTGGTGTLSYSINGGGSYQASNVFPITAEGSYTVRVKDDNGCTADSNIVIVAPQLTLSAVLNKDITCNPAPTAAQITLTPTGGSGTFTYTSTPNSGTFAGNVFTTSTPGNYTFTVTDSNICSASTTTAIVVTPTVNPEIDDTTLPGNIGVTQIQSINCNGEDTAAIAIAIDNTKGLAPFVFNIRNNTTGVNYGTQTSGLAAGNYTITVTDARGCNDTEDIIIEQPDPIVVDYDVDPITCGAGGVSLGRIIVNGVTGGTPNYTYHVTGANYNQQFTNQPGNSQVFDIVDFGLYELIVTDVNGCQQLHQNILVASPPDDLDITVLPSPADCSTDGSAIVAVGSGGLTGAGPFHFAVYTGPGITYTAPTTFPWYDEDAVGSKKTTIPNLKAGVTYTFIVHDQVTGCYYFETSTIPIPTNSTITVDSLVENNITCKGAANGNVTFTMNHTYGVDTPVTYQIYNSQSVAPVGGSVNITIPASGSLVIDNFGSLPLGNYFVLITEAAGATNAGCSSTSSPFNITESAIDLSVTASKIKNVNCNEDGVIAAQAKDGTAPYTYQYLLASATAPTASTAGWITNTTFATSVTGNYIVYVKDAYGCIKNAAITLDADDAPVVTPPAAPVCYDGTAFTITFSGTVDPDVIGGATYSVNGSAFQASPSFTFNAAGTYNLVIKDGNGCTANVDYEVYPKLNMSALLTKELDCTASPEAQITLAATGGNTTPSANYTYEVSFNGGGFVSVATNPYLASASGNYIFRVTDANNATVCRATTSFDLDPIPTTVFGTTVTNVSCNGGSDGTITVNVTGGEGPYRYSLDGGVTEYTTNTFTGLTAGTAYVVTVRNARNCILDSAPISITEPGVLAATADVTTDFGCNAGNVPQPAVVTVMASSGTAPYSYNFDGGSTYYTDNTLVVADNGTDQTIHYYVKDANGCLTDGTVNVDRYLPLTDITFALSTAPVCPTNVGDVALTVVGGYVPMAKYEIISPITVDNGTSNVFTALAPNTYLFKVTDANGCSIERNYTIDPVTPIAIVGAMINDISCNAANGTTNNGSAQFTVSDFSATGNYSVVTSPVVAAAQISQAGDVITLTGLSAGTYTVTVEDNTTHCSSSAAVTITEPDPIAFTATGTKVFCTQDISKITVSAVTGGTGSYTYAVVIDGATAPVASAYTTNPVMSVDTNLTDLLWDVYVRDTNGCTQKVDVTITNDAPPTITVPAQQCYVGSDLTVDLDAVTSVYGGIKSYTLNGSALATSIATFTSAGTYILGIKDDNGCEEFVSYTIQNQLLASAILTKDLYCAGSVDATIDVVISGGVGSYSYQMYLDGTAQGLPTTVTGSGFTASVGVAGSYTFVITDANSPQCSVTTNAVIVTTPAVPAATAVATNVSCNAGNDGTITLTPTNGVAPYTYVLTGTGANTTGDLTGVYTGLIAGTTYSVVMTDAKGCPSAAIPVTITEPGVLAATADVTTDFGCNAGNVPQPAVVTVTASSGTAPYSYNFDGGSTYYTDNTLVVADNGTDQTIHYYVKDANGCLTDGTVNVDRYLPLTDITFALSTAPVCPTNVGDVALTVVGGYVPMAKYEIISPITVDNGTSNVFTALAPNTYLFKVTDANGCSIERNYTIDPVTPIAIVGAMINDISCNAANGTTNNGSAQFTVSDFSATGNYSVVTSPVVAAAQISQAGDVITLTGLSAGTYTVTVEDNTTHCSSSAAVTITEPDPIAFTATGTKVFCTQDISKITVSAVTGGTGSYTYAVVIDGATAPVASAYTTNPVMSVDTNLTDLLWDVYVRDTNGCTQKVDVTITNDAPPTITVPAQQCYVGSDLTVDLDAVTSVYGGIKSYTLNGSALATSIATFTSAGTYILGIKDDNGCEEFVSYTIQNQLLASAILTKDLYCAGSVDATIDVVISGGVGSYSYQMYLDGTAQGLPTTVTGSGFTASVGVAGSYTFVITDANSPQCSVTTNAVIVTTPAVPAATAVATNVSCNAGNDGTITLTPTNGVAPYTYVLTGTGANTTGDLTGVYTGLIAGTTYSVVMTDAKGCPSAAIPVTITEPGVLAASADVTPFGCDTANASKDAIVTIIPTGGTADYTYSFDGGATFQSSASFTVNTAQTINYVVLDAKGCSVTGSAIVAPYLPPTDMDLSASPIYCNTLGTVATVTVNAVAGGVAPYTYEIISPASAVVTAPIGTNSFANLAPDTYVIKATDNNGCSTTKTIIVEEADKIAVTHQVINDVYCNGDSTGTVDLTVSNYITAGDYTFSLSPDMGTMTQNGDVIRYANLPQGNYTFTVIDDVSGCTFPVNFTINEPAFALSSTSVATNINCDEDNATITVTANGGTAPYKYAVAKAGDPVPAVTSFVPGYQFVVDTNNGVDVNWVVYVLDSNNCPANNAQPISLDANPIIASAIPTHCPSATGTYEITVTATGFNAALLYSIDGVSYDTNNVITVNAPGLYNVRVKDANGCISIVTPVTIMEPLILTPTVTSSPSCTDGDGVVAVATTGGSGNYVYNIDGGAFGIATTLTGVSSGAHIVGVRDTTTLCEAFISIDLKPATQITGFALTPTPVTCNGGNDGTITATMDTPADGINDNPKYTYSLDGGTPQDSPVFTGLTEGTYTVVVTSERGCTASQTTTIGEPDLVVVNSVDVAQFICTTGNTSNFATITVPVTEITGGSGTYTVYEFIKNGNAVPVQRGTSNTYTEYDLSGGTYTVNVYDSNGCMGTYATPIIIDPYIALDKINVAKTAITCDNPEDITATAVDASGTAIAGIEYTLTNVSGTITFPANTTGNFTGLAVGQYIITALNPATGCSIQKPHYVNEPNTFILKAEKNSDVVCYGSNEGAVTITLIDNIGNPDEAGAFDYTVSGPVPSSGSSATAGPLNLSGLTAGEYTVSVVLTNSPFCTVTTTFTIGQPDARLEISEIVNPITCISGNNDGSIVVTATGGWAGGYEYRLVNSANTVISDWSSTREFPNLTAETYTVSVRDLKGCIASVSVPLVIPTPIVVTATPDMTIVPCYGDASATITATATGGDGTNYSYTLNRITATEVISSGPQNSPSFSGLGVGTYSITVTDGFTCSGVSAEITITEPTIVTPLLVHSGNATCLTQDSLTLSATGGTGPYTYSADANFATVLGSFTEAIPATFNVTPGNYKYYVRDANGCIGFVSNGISVEPLAELDIDVDVLNAVINCKGDATGVIVATATGGLGNYVYSLLNNATNATVQGPKADGNFADLPAGEYTVHVVSGDCEDDSAVIPITEPDLSISIDPIVTPVTCNGNKDGKIVINGTGGTGNIMYAISPNLNQFFDDGVFDNLEPGFYQVIAQDVSGCYLTHDFEIIQPTPLTAALIPDTMLPEQCKDEKNGSFSIEVKGATGPYSYSLDVRNGTYTQGTVGQTRFDFDNLSGGRHIVYIKDAASCTYELEVIMPDSVVLNPTVETNYDCVNNTQANFVKVDPGYEDETQLDYSLDGGIIQPGNTFTNVPAGDHTITVRHTNGCSADVKFNIKPYVALNAIKATGQQEMNIISVTATGGAPAYEYSFNGEPFTSSNKYTIYKSGDYPVIVRDQNGCTFELIVPGIYVDVCIPNYFTPNGDGLYDDWGPGCTNIYNNLEFSIFDRYGRMIAKYHYGQKWDGKYNGEELPTGDYWYVLKLNDKKDDREFVGHFTLYR